MKIAVNTRLLLKDKLEGIGWVTYETLRRVVFIHPEVDFYFLFDRKPDPKFIFASNVHPIVLKPKARHPLLYIIYFEWSVKKYLNKLNPDLFISPDGYLSLHSNVAQLAVFHDLNFEHFPKDMPRLALWHYKTYFPKFAKKAKRIVTVSEFSKQDIIDCYHIDPEKIDVVYNGANTIFKPIDNKNITAIREKYTAGLPYFMFVGSLHPRKNLARLFEAFDLFKAATLSEAKLLIVGEKRWWTEQIKRSYENMKYKNEVCFCGRLSAEDLHLATASALASVYVSYFEGFGIPIVEAFRCGTPVITSNVTSMPEVAGDAALLVNPFDVEDIAFAMEQMLNPELRSELVNKGFERQKLFTWDFAAQGLWNSIEKAL